MDVLYIFKVQTCTSLQERITVQLWDFAGQREYYITHKAFLSSSAIYILVFDLRLQREGVASLKPWLLDIQVSNQNYTWKK